MKLVKISITRTIAAVSVALFAALPSFADPIYVSTTAELTDALANASDGDEIVMAKTTFVLEAQLKVTKAVTLRGEGENWETVIDGNGAIDGMSLTATGAKLHNFTLTNCGGMWAGSAGINMSNASTISNVVFRGIGNQWTGNQGTRFPLTASAGLVTHCWITNNIAPKNAGALLKGTAVMENCYIADNVDRGINLNESQNGMVVLASGNATLRNCTIVNNDSPLCAVFVSGDGKVYNNIIRNNTAGGGIGNWKIKNVTWKSRWKNNCTEPLDTGFPESNVSDDPLLMPDSLHFFKNSPCNGTADAANAPAYDIHGNVRGETPSMGCLEYEAPQSGFYCSIMPSAVSVDAPGTIALGVVLEGTPTGDLSYAWDFNGDGEVDSAEAQPVLSETGKYHVSVVLTDQAGETASTSYAKTLQIAPPGGFKIYVSPTGDGTSPYGGFATGVTTLQAGIDLAVAGETVLLDKATFMQTAGVSIKKSITVCGAGENWETVLNGNKGGNIIEVATDGTVLHSLTLTNFGGQWSEGLALTMSGNVIVSNVVFRGNGNEWKGAGDGTRFPCLVGGGLMTHCWITNNVTPGNAGIRLNGGTVENCYIADNIDRGCMSDKGRVGIVMVNGGTLRNCTIVNNQSAYGAVYYKSASGKIYNNIVWGNTQVGTAEQNNWVFEGALSQNGWIANCTAPLCGTAENGNISADPLMQEDQMHFFKTSPCNGAANASNAPAYDIEGNERPTPPSMGAFEYVAGALACTISATATTVDRPNTSVLSCAFDGEVTAPITYEWDLKGDGTLISRDANPSISEIGIYRPSVKAVDADGKTATGTFVGTITVYDEGGAVYVTAGENPNAKPPYATWATAATNLVDAFGYSQAGKEIRLAAGTHYLKDSFNVTKGVTITGVDGPGVTFVANTNDTDRLFDLKAPGAVLENVTIRDGDFRNNWGGAIVMLEPGTVRNCRFIGNLVSGHGAVRTEQSGSRIERCVFRGNCVPRGWNGGEMQGPTCVKLAGSNEKVVNCLFEANSNYNSSASSIYYSGVAINLQSTSAQILNCTMVGNVSSNAQHAAICNDTLNGTYCEATVRNCIAVGNTRLVDGEVIPGNDIGAVPAKQSNSLVWPTAFDYSGFTKVLTVDPQFIDAANGDYHLKAGSPAVNGGDNLDYTAESLDLDGKVRVYKFGLKSSKADMGCYESPYGMPGLMLLVR